ncbi:hypothetical protein [Microbacterium sp. 22242]|uniref:hypothetical protein n=1 Tax=Microbacterium sp. 22242 TaxID=3453896 RepID=UPI003F83A85E
MSEIYDEGLLPPNVHRPMEKGAGSRPDGDAEAARDDGAERDDGREAREARLDPEEKEDAARSQDPGRVDGHTGAEGGGVESTNEDTPADTSEPPD